jgi:hypothetical protein
VLTEDRVGHYPEFREFFVRQFSLDAEGLSRPGYVRAPSGMIYALVFIGRSGEPFPDGIEIYALPYALETLDDTNVDADLWALLRWIIKGVAANGASRTSTQPADSISWACPERIAAHGARGQCLIRPRAQSNLWLREESRLTTGRTAPVPIANQIRA